VTLGDGISTCTFRLYPTFSDNVSLELVYVVMSTQNNLIIVTGRAKRAEPKFVTICANLLRTLRHVISTWNNTPFNYRSPRIAGLRNKALYCVPAFALTLPFACRTDAIAQVSPRVHPAFFLRDADALISSGCMIRCNYTPLHLFLSLFCFIAWLDLWAFDCGTREAREDWLVEALVGLVSLWLRDTGSERGLTCGSLFSSVDRRSVAYLFVVVFCSLERKLSLLCNCCSPEQVRRLFITACVSFWVLFLVLCHCVFWTSRSFLLSK